MISNRELVLDYLEETVWDNAQSYYQLLGYTPDIVVYELLSLDNEVKIEENE